MATVTNISTIARKSEMYAMVISIEEDFIANFKEKLIVDDIPTSIQERAKKTNSEKDAFLAMLRGLDIQSYIEICNANLTKLNFNLQQKNFINKQLTDIIPIRNAVMHPRPLGYFDYPILKEVFNNISKELTCFFWTNVEKTKYQIENEPDTLAPPPKTLKKNERIIENLPSLLDYEETSFVGRSKEIGEIKEKLNKNNIHILSIIGDGGVGKTATTLKLLYDMLDDPNCKYELIIWTTLKTNELSNSDFKEIATAIKSTTEMYEQLAPFVASQASEDDTKSFIIELAKNLNTLFVLDNLETINTEEIKSFIYEFSEYGKVLITSRIGLGEMEYRYKLNGLNETDVLDYTNRLLELYGFEYLFTKEQIKHYVVDEFHANPLAIKWFIRCIYNGQSVDEVIRHKADVINFCMENVYEKLSSEARTLLRVLTVANVELSFPEIIYYLDGEIKDCTTVKYAINELGKCNFIDEEKFKRDNAIAVTDFAKEFLKLNYKDTKQAIRRFKELRTKLTSFGQNLLVRRVNSALDIKTIRFKNNAELVVATLLHNSLQMSISKEEAFGLIEYAKELLPTYYEIFLVSARLYGTAASLKAEDEYKKAIQYCSTPKEKVRVSIQYADFLVRMNNYQEAVEVLEDVEKLGYETEEIKIQMAKIWSYMGQYEQAELVISELNLDKVTNDCFNKIQTTKADIHKRRIESIDVRATQKRLIGLRLSYACLEECLYPDAKVFDYMSKILVDLSYMYIDTDALEFILEIVEKHYKNINKTPKYKEFKTQISERLVQIDNENFKKHIAKYIKDYNDYLELLNENEAVVYNLKEGYGFCKNCQYPQGLFFSMKGLPQDITYGDILQFEDVKGSKGKLSVIGIKRVDNIDERIMKL